MIRSDLDVRRMSRALELALRGQGRVEPNPLVGCVIARGEATLAEAWHEQFGQPHAEVLALRQAGPAARGATLYVSLEPCCHHGKTPPCTEAIIQAGIGRVVLAVCDPFPQVSGEGERRLRAAGIAVDVGLLEPQARRLNAPYFKRLRTGRPWLMAKWAMSLDGKLATHRGQSRWISSEASRAVVHQLRGRVDAVMIGSGTARADDPLLTARPAGPRLASRIVLASSAALALESQLAQTARQAPVLVAVGPAAQAETCAQLEQAGCEIWRGNDPSPQVRLEQLLDELGRRSMTNVLVEGGSRLLGGLLDAGLIDEVHVFIAPKLIGGRAAPAPIAGTGVALPDQAWQLEEAAVERTGEDLYLHGHLRRHASPG